MKAKLNLARKIGNQEEINKIEIKSANKILFALREYPYQSTNSDNGSQPSKIIKFKEIQCIGFSLIGHAFLKELGIKHKCITINNHVALELNIGDIAYYFDASSSMKVNKLYYGKQIEFNGNISQYRQIGVQFGIFRVGKKMYGISGEAESGLLSVICNNKGSELKIMGRYMDAMNMANMGIRLNPENYANYFTKGSSLNELGKYNEALEMIEIGIKLNPKDYSVYYIKGIIQYNLKKYREAIENYNTALRLNLKNYSIYLNKGSALFNLERYEEAILCYNIALRYNPENIDILGNIVSTLGRQGKNKEAEIIKDKIDKLKNKQ